MKNQPRDVTGGSEVWGGMIPGYNLANYILGIFSVPIETFLRRDFGERYYTKANFIAGFIVLILFNTITSLIGSLLGLLNPLSWFSHGDSAPASWMGGILKWYFLFGMAHFLTIWVRDILGKSRHSYDSGTGWFRFIGKAIYWVMNKACNLLIRFVADFAPQKYKEKLLDSLPIFRDPHTFTERYIEPFVVLFMMIVALSNGQTAASMWLAVSFGALNLVTGRRHEQERCYVLDIRDQIIEARAWQEIIAGKETSNAEHMQRTLNETINEVDKNPDIMEVIQRDKPSLAKAIATIQAKKKNALD